RETTLGDDISSMAEIGATRPWLAWPMTLAMLGLAGIPATAGFVGKLFLIEASIDGQFTWLGVFIVVGSMISLAYYLRVVAAVWMREPPASERAGGCGRMTAGARPRVRVAGGWPGTGPARWGGAPPPPSGPRRRACAPARNS